MKQTTKIEVRNCKYRKCLKDISHMRKNAKFCNRKCKCNERTYIKRNEVFIERIYKEEVKNLELYKYLRYLNK